MKGEADTCGGEKVFPTQCAGANQTVCAVPKIEKECKKGESNLQPWDVGKEGRKPVLTLTPCASAFRT